jgi:hypothetical protein
MAGEIAMKTILISLFLICLAVQLAPATAQIPDALTFRGQKYALFVNPLEAYFKSHKERKPKGGVISSALWRGYVASFELRDSALYVSDIEIEEWTTDSSNERETTWKSVVQSAFPDSSERYCTWYSGLLVLPVGEMTSYVHMGYASLYEKYLVLRVKDGLLTKVREFTGKEYFEFKKRQFQAYKATDEFQASLKELTKDGSDPKEMEGFLFEYEIEYTSRFLLDEL